MTTIEQKKCNMHRLYNKIHCHGTKRIMYNLLRSKPRPHVVFAPYVVANVIVHVELSNLM